MIYSYITDIIDTITQFLSSRIVINSNMYMTNSVLLIIGAIILVFLVIIILQVKAKYKAKNSMRKNITTQLQKADEKNTNLFAELSQAKQTVEALERNVLTLKTHAKTLDDRITALTDEKAELAKLKRTLKTRVTNLEKQNANLKEQLKLLELKEQESLDKSTEKDDVIARLTKEAKELSQLVETAKSQVQTNSREYQNQLQALETTIQDLKEKVASKEKEIKQNKATIDTLSDELQTAKAQNEALTQEVKNTKKTTNTEQSNIFERLSMW